MCKHALCQNLSELYAFLVEAVHIPQEALEHDLVLKVCQKCSERLWVYLLTNDGQLVKVVVDVGDEKEIREYPVKQLKFRSKRRRDHGERLSKEEMRKLAELEDKGGHSKLNE